MTVCVLDELRRGFYETFARITWIDGDWVGLSQGIKGDYYADETPRLVTAFPLVFGHGIADAALRNVRLEGNRAEQEEGIGGCRGGSVYFAASRRIEVTDVTERDFFGEGLGFQMCRDMRIIDCAFDGNTGNGLHPGAGSTNCLFESCSAAGNGRSGFFFCVRANHITVTGCSFENNVVGVSVGIRDCNNVVDACRVAGNRGDGVLFREDGVAPGEVHSVRVSHCDIKENAWLRVKPRYPSGQMLTTSSSRTTVSAAFPGEQCPPFTQHPPCETSIATTTPSRTAKSMFQRQPKA